MGLTVRVDGGKKASDAIRKLGPVVTKKVQLVIRAAALRIHADAVRSVQRGPKTGRAYGNHIASAPDQAPATDTGFLASNIVILMDTDGLGAQVVSRAKYSWYLEFGTAVMLPRPFMHPAFVKNKAWINAKIKQAVAGKS